MDNEKLFANVLGSVLLGLDVDDEERREFFQINTEELPNKTFKHVFSILKGSPNWNNEPLRQLITSSL